MKHHLWVSAFLIGVLAMNPYAKVFAQTYEKGIDISTYQGEVDFTKVKSDGITGIYIRAGEGESIVDGRFEENYKGAEEVNLDYGFYFYVTATSVSDAQTQGKRFADLISGLAYTLRPAMDFETFGDLSTAESNEIALAFLEELEKETGVTPVIYSDADNVENRWNSSLSGYPLWVAAYENLSTPEDYDLPENTVWTSWSGYQYTDSLTVEGISGDVDGDIFTSALFISQSDEQSDSTENDTSDTSDKSDISDSDSTTGSSYTVKKGDTLTKIAEKYNVTVDELVTYNKIINKNLIYIGEQIKIPTTSQVVTYTVKSGDTLWQIAKGYDITVTSIAEENQISNVNMIYVGEVLKITL